MSMMNADPNRPELFGGHIAMVADDFAQMLGGHVLQGKPPKGINHSDQHTEGEPSTHRFLDIRVAKLLLLSVASGIKLAPFARTFLQNVFLRYQHMTK
jgi:hypothetical protein